jgi:N-acetyl-anhydromuramyl-L-alanine amidase AmpD
MVVWMKKRSRTDYIVVHCADTPAKMDIGLQEIRKWHTSPDPNDASKPWLDVGYHFIIRRDGTREIGRQIDAQGSHVKGFNSCSVGICLVGGKGDDGKACNNFTKAQFDALWEVLQILRVHYPKAEVLGHKDLNPGKACPAFEVQPWYMKKLKEHN